MIPYLLAEDGSLSMSEVFEGTSIITKNQKLDIFVLELSFLGWNLLGALLFGIGKLFVLPYTNAVYAELYVVSKERWKAVL